MIQQQLGDVGIVVNYEASPGAEGYGRYTGGSFPMFMFGGLSSQPWLDATLLLAPGGAWNPLPVDDPEITALMDAITVTSGDEQAAAYQALNTYVVENAWSAPMYVGHNLNAHWPEIDVESQSGQVVPSIPNFSAAS